MCSGCGNIKKDLKLSDRIYHCDICGLILDRDVNAASNIKRLGTNRLGESIRIASPKESLPFTAG